MKNSIFCLVLIGMLFCSSIGLAHDTWIESNARCVPWGDPVYVQLCLGNHANQHRDYRLASSLSSLDGLCLEAIDQQGKRYNLRGQLKRFGTSEKEGTWLGQWNPPKAGRYLLQQRLDIMHGKIHVIHNGLAAVEVGNEFQEKAPVLPVTESGLEFLPLVSIDRLRVGDSMELQLLLDGKPKADALVSLLPLGETLTSATDDRYEAKSDSEGKVTFKFPSANRYLIVAHHRVDSEAGAGFDATAYTATLHLQVSRSAEDIEK